MFFVLFWLTRVQLVIFDWPVGCMTSLLTNRTVVMHMACASCQN